MVRLLYAIIISLRLPQNERWVNRTLTKRIASGTKDKPQLPDKQEFDRKTAKAGEE
jgi:hypothetical protein